MYKILKTLFIVLLLIQNSLINLSFADSNPKEKYFIITAYYSPLPNQNSYMKWSYTRDIKLNWWWKVTASWKGVFEWLLAWPKNYPFWTKIYFDWFGVWVVEDRWWAIVKTGVKWQEHDRIDIWMWYWDEWLSRAKKWWKRTIKWVVVTSNTKTSINFNKSKLFWVENINVNPESQENEVKKLQEFFNSLGLYKWDIDWIYKSIEGTLLKFQIDNWIINNKEDWGAWYFWKQTKEALSKIYFKEVSGFPLVKEEKSNLTYFKNTNAVCDKYRILINYWDLIIKPESNQVDIKKFQEMMTQLGFYTWTINWNYKSIENDIIKLQLKLWLIKNNDSWWAWYFWSKWKEALWIYLSKQNETKNTIMKEASSLSQTDKNKIIKLWKRIEEKIHKITIDKNRKDRIIANLKKRIDSIIEKSNKQSLISKLEYLKKIL